MDHLPAAKILVVDDNQVDRSTLSLLLGAAGYQVFEAGDAPAAFSLARRIRPDLVVLDIFFPPDVSQSGNSWDAFMMIEWFQRMGVIGAAPVIVISGAEPGQFQGRCLAGGVAAFLAKPINSRELLDTIRQLLEDRVSEVAAASPLAKLR
jgi:CheY-like chemotaxis protein